MIAYLPINIHVSKVQVSQYSQHIVEWGKKADYTTVHRMSSVLFKIYTFTSLFKYCYVSNN